jgi:ATP-dependent Clp protease protease subunit
MALHTGKPVEDVARETDRDNFLTAEEALAFGMVDKVLQKRVLAG